MRLGVGCPCPPVRNDIVTRVTCSSFFVFLFFSFSSFCILLFVPICHSPFTKFLSSISYFHSIFASSFPFEQLIFRSNLSSSPPYFFQILGCDGSTTSSMLWTQSASTPAALSPTTTIHSPVLRSWPALATTTAISFPILTDNSNDGANEESRDQIRRFHLDRRNHQPRSRWHHQPPRPQLQPVLNVPRERGRHRRVADPPPPPPRRRLLLLLL